MENKKKINLRLILKLTLFIVGIVLMIASILAVTIKQDSEFYVKLGTALLVMGIVFTAAAVPIKTSKLDDDNEQIK